MTIASIPEVDGTTFSGVLIPVAQRRLSGTDPDLARAHPVMVPRPESGQPTEPDPELVRSIQHQDVEVVPRRRSSSTSSAGAGMHHGWREINFIRQLSKDIRLETNAGINKAGREMKKRGYDQALIDHLIAHHHHGNRIMKALAGGSGKATERQREQFLCLCIVDVNRTFSDQDFLENPFASDSSNLAARPYGNPLLRDLVAGAKCLLQFSGLRDALELWFDLRLESDEPGQPIQILRLADEFGLFDTNIRRVLNAYEEAANSGGDSIMQRLPRCLVKHGMSGPSEREREALRGASGTHCAEFHRKLEQQYAMLCRSFGLPLPAMTELILIDDD